MTKPKKISSPTNSGKNPISKITKQSIQPKSQTSILTTSLQIKQIKNQQKTKKNNCSSLISKNKLQTLNHLTTYPKMYRLRISRKELILTTNKVKMQRKSYQTEIFLNPQVSTAFPICRMTTTPFKLLQKMENSIMKIKAKFPKLKALVYIRKFRFRTELRLQTAQTKWTRHIKENGNERNCSKYAQFTTFK